MLPKWTSLLIVLLVFNACASTGSSGPRPRSDLITASELAQVRVANLYEAIDRLRPRWLDVRAVRSFNASSSIVVYQGQTYLGGPAILRELGIGGVQEIRYLDGATASATLPGIGTRQVEGAIVINPN